jgi:excisionase family DNA binding protein
VSVLVIENAQLEKLAEDAARLAAAAVRAESLDDRLLTRDEAAKFLRVDRSTLARLVKDQGLPVLYVGSSPRFEKRELLQWMKR